MESVAIKSRKIRFPIDNIFLEGLLYVPDGEGPFPAVVVCHPHPLYGGSMENNVINSVCEALVNKSIVAFKFNFQGVGDSQGTFSIGSERQDDVRAAISFVISNHEVNPDRVGLAGYSAGAAWGLSAAYRDTRVKALAAISPPLSLFDFNILLDCRKPKLMISGSRDAHIPNKTFLDFCRKLPEPEEHDIVEDADHSWWGYETMVADKVADFFGRTFDES